MWSNRAATFDYLGSPRSSGYEIDGGEEEAERDDLNLELLRTYVDPSFVRDEMESTEEALRKTEASLAAIQVAILRFLRSHC